jgi:cobalt/nickel transport protein
MSKRLWIFLFITIALAVFVSPFASSSPDGLEKVAIDLGFMEFENAPMFEIIPDYSVTFIPFEGVSTAISGFIGLMIIGLFYTFFRATAKKESV